jgi:Tol biopolymer transport system component
VKAEGQGARQKVIFVVRNLDGGGSAKEIVMPPEFQNVNSGPQLGWTPDGRALTFLSTIGNAQHLVMQSLVGGPPVQLTHFDEEPSMIVMYAWSMDGKKIAIVGQKYNARDIILFTGFR